MRVAKYQNMPLTIILAAGKSQRMGQQKLLLPWKQSTVIETVVQSFLTASVARVIVVTGAAHVDISRLLQGRAGVEIAANPRYMDAEMFVSLKTGLLAMNESELGAVPFLIGLGDQPQITSVTIRALIDAWYADKPKILIPSYNLRRGHPWMLAPICRGEILAMQDHQTMRDYLATQQEHIRYLNVDTPEILKDLDTPEDYENEKRLSGA